MAYTKHLITLAKKAKVAAQTDDIEILKIIAVEIHDYLLGITPAPCGPVTFYLVELTNHHDEVVLGTKGAHEAMQRIYAMGRNGKPPKLASLRALLGGAGSYQRLLDLDDYSGDAYLTITRIKD